MLVSILLRRANGKGLRPGRASGNCLFSAINLSFVLLPWMFSCLFLDVKFPASRHCDRANPRSWRENHLGTRRVETQENLFRHFDVPSDIYRILANLLKLAQTWSYSGVVISGLDQYSNPFNRTIHVQCNPLKSVKSLDRSISPPMFCGRHCNFSNFSLVAETSSA